MMNREGAKIGNEQGNTDKDVPKIKICGIRSREDVLVVNKYLPEYIGFVFAASKRYVAPEDVKDLANLIDIRIKKVGVFVNEELSRVIDIVNLCGLDVVQLHGEELPEYIADIKMGLSFCKAHVCHSEYDLHENLIKSVDVWKAIRVKDESSIEDIKKYDANAFVLDTFIEGTYGGAGKVFDWKLAIKAKKYGNIILAGGLSLENIKEAVEAVKPFAVDVSSGVETEGWKDELKIRNFIDIVRNWR